MVPCLNFELDRKNHIYVSDFQNRQGSSFTKQGELLKKFTFQEYIPLAFSVDKAGNLYCTLSVRESGSEDRKIKIQKMNMKGNKLVNFGIYNDLQTQMTHSGNVAFGLSPGRKNGPVWLFDKIAQFYFAARDNYEISIFSQSNDLLKIFRRK